MAQPLRNMQTNQFSPFRSAFSLWGREANATTKQALQQKLSWQQQTVTTIGTRKLSAGILVL